MTNKKRSIISLIIKAVLSMAAFNGILLSFLQSGDLKSRVFLFFTIQSNLWIGALAVLCFILLTIDMALRKPTNRRWLNVLSLILTVSILITGFVFVFVLVPTMDSGAWSIANILTHVVTPLVALVDFFFSQRKIKFQKWDFLFSNTPLAYYLVFSICGFFLKWNYGNGNHYPYFFLNFASPIGLFGFSMDYPFEMGSFYWILVILLFASGLSLLLQWLANKIIKREGNNG